MSDPEDKSPPNTEPVSAERDGTANPKPPPEPAANAGVKTARVGGLVVLLVIGLSLTWYLLADRHTPYTSQARVQGYIVGVAPKVGGMVTEVMVGNNESVQAGQLLFKIDRSQYEIALRKARSDLENARSQVEAGNAAVEAARAKLEAAKANLVRAEKDTARLQRLREDDPGSISLRRLEVSQAGLDQARAQVQAAEVDIQRAIEQKGGLDDTNNAILKTAESAVAKAELDLSNTRVTAETKGVITDLRAEAGQFAGAGTPIMTLVSLHDVWINAEFTENNLGLMQPGQNVEITFDSLPGRIFQGTIRSIGIGVSAGQLPPPGALPSIDNSRDWLRQAQRFPVIIDFDPAQEEVLLQQLRIGGQASVIVYTGEKRLLNRLGQLFVRLMSWSSYAY